MRASTFNWSQLDRNNLAKMVSLCKHDIVNQLLPINQIHKTLSKHIKSHLPIKVTKRLSFETEPGCMYIGGTYYSDLDAESKIAIELVLQYNPLDSHIMIESKRFKKNTYGIADTILHEIIHMRQYRSRKFKVLPDYASSAEKRKQRLDQMYLGCTDEIDAYSFNIACDLYSKYKGSTDAIVNYLNKHRGENIRKKNNWIKYLQTFNNDHNHPVIKQVKKRVIYYLPYAAIGKPFKSTNWITK